MYMDYYHVDSNSLAEQRRPGIQCIHLPIEIIMLVLIAFRSDKEMLKTCTLVCKLWLPCARYYLIPPKLAIYLTATTAGDIFDIFKSPCTRLGSYVYHYSVQKQYDDLPLTCQDSENSSNRPVQAVDFYDCLHSFSGIFNRLRVLTLDDIISLSSTDFKPIIPLIRAFDSLTDLRLRRCTFPTLDELLSVLCAKRALTRLTLEEIFIRNPHPPYSSELRLPDYLNHIGLFTVEQRYIIDWILGQKYIPPIMSLCFGAVGGPDDQRAIGDLLMALGPHLKHLKFYIPKWNNEFSLAHNTELQSLSISHYRLGDLDDREGASAAALLDILNQISSKNVTSVNLWFISELEGFRAVHWASFANVLESSKYGNLKILRVKAISMGMTNWELEVLEKILKRHFPGLLACGVLRVRQKVPEFESPPPPRWSPFRYSKVCPSTQSALPPLRKALYNPQSTHLLWR